MASSYIDEALQKKLLARSSLTAYIGKRLYHIKAPAGAPLPHIIFFQVAPDNTPVIFGKPNSGEPLFQFSCISDDAETPCEAFLIAWEVINELRHYQGTYDGIEVRLITTTGPEMMELDAQRKLILCAVTAAVEYVEP